MKKISLILVFFAFASCESIQETINHTEPVASFNISKQSRGLVTANNLSKDYETCIIEWGDGTEDICYGGNIPDHRYDMDGNYSITLKAKGTRGKTDSSTKSVRIDNTEGDLTVYLAKAVNEPMVSFYVNNTIVFNATKISTYSGILNCNDPLGEAGIKKSYKPGKYQFRAVSVPNGRSTWAFEVTIQNNACTVRKLN